MDNLRNNTVTHEATDVYVNTAALRFVQQISLFT